MNRNVKVAHIGEQQSEFSVLKMITEAISPTPVSCIKSSLY